MTKTIAHWKFLACLLAVLPAAAVAQTAATPAAAQPQAAAAAPAPTDAPQRLCTESDLTGTYTLIDVTENPPGELTKWFREYGNHYLFFMPNHAYGYIASKHGIDTEKQLMDTEKKETVGLTHTIDRKYELDNQGVLNLTVDDRLEHSYRCLMTLKPNVRAIPGDLLLWGYNNAGVQTQEIFRPKTLKAE